MRRVTDDVGRKTADRFLERSNPVPVQREAEPFTYEPFVRPDRDEDAADVVHLVQGRADRARQGELDDPGLYRFDLHVARVETTVTYG